MVAARKRVRYTTGHRGRQSNAIVDDRDLAAAIKELEAGREMLREAHRIPESAQRRAAIAEALGRVALGGRFVDDLVIRDGGECSDSADASDSDNAAAALAERSVELETAHRRIAELEAKLNAVHAEPAKALREAPSPIAAACSESERTEGAPAALDAVAVHVDTNDDSREPGTALTPRPYQIEAARVLPDRIGQHGRVLAVGPTGCGKNLIASLLIKAESTLRVLFVVHRYEMADQAWQALRSNGIECGILMAQEESLYGSRRVAPDARVQVASVQTAIRREAMADVNLIVFDEAHRVLAESYQSIARTHPDAGVLGLTATAERADGRGLGEFFRDMYIIAQPSELQRDGYLASPRWFGARSDVVAHLSERLRSAGVSNGDYAPKDLARAVDSRFLLGRIVSEAMRIAPGVSKAVFAGSVDHSRRLTDEFTKQGVIAVHLDSDTPPKERAAMLTALGNGSIEAICNCDVLGEGWDLPGLGAVVLGRPFRSRTRYLQAVGRGMRWRKGAQPIVIDHGNNAPRLGVWPGDDVEWSLDGRRRSAGDPLWKQCESCLEKIPLGAAVCEHCGHECPIERERRQREEVEARLEEMTRAEYMALRKRVEKVAKKKGAPEGWVDKVTAEMMAR